VKFASILFLLPALLAVSCKPEPKSKIVQQVEAAGAGDLSTASATSIQQWFLHHEDLAKHINKECEAVKPNANATWSDSTEGRTCHAASFFSDAPVFKPTN